MAGYTPVICRFSATRRVARDSGIFLYITSAAEQPELPIGLAAMGSETGQPLTRGAVVGVVIAGGRSVRFGGEKAAAILAGKPLLMWAVQRLQHSCAAVAVNARPGTEAEALSRAAGLPLLYDAPGDAAGPLAGVKAGLAWALGLGARALAVSPCDAPLLPDDLYARLLQAAGSGAAMAETAEGLQPLCAVWPASALTRVTEALAGGAHPPTWLVLESLGAGRARFEDREAFANVNTRADLAAIAARQARRN
jgi:molybdopterin-guanine dinucleotide biosynthesis protein A